MKRSVLVFSILILLVTAACYSTTKINRVWRDDELVKEYNSVLVIGVFHRENARKLAENSFASQLGGTGVKALASFGTIKDISGKDREKLIQKIKATGAEAVLAIRLIELKNKKEYEPLSTYKIPYAYYSRLQSYLRETKLDKETSDKGTIYGIAVAEANLYDVATGKLVWSAVSDLHLEDSSTKIIQSFSKAIAKQLSSGGLI